MPSKQSRFDFAAGFGFFGANCRMGIACLIITSPFVNSVGVDCNWAEDEGWSRACGREESHLSFAGAILPILFLTTYIVD